MVKVRVETGWPQGLAGRVYRAAAHHFVLGAYLQNEKENMLNEKNKSYGKLKKNIRKMLAL